MTRDRNRNRRRTKISEPREVLYVARIWRGPHLPPGEGAERAAARRQMRSRSADVCARLYAPIKPRSHPPHPRSRTRPESAIVSPRDRFPRIIRRRKRETMHAPLSTRRSAQTDPQRIRSVLFDRGTSVSWFACADLVSFFVH
ncbi:unnamed protein product, partial [Iphiclides podalirius]